MGQTDLSAFKPFIIIYRCENIRDKKLTFITRTHIQIISLFVHEPVRCHLDIPAVAGFLCSKHRLIMNGIKRTPCTCFRTVLMRMLQRTLSICIYPTKWQYYKHICLCAGQELLQLISVDGEVKLAT